MVRRETSSGSRPIMVVRPPTAVDRDHDDGSPLSRHLVTLLNKAVEADLIAGHQPHVADSYSRPCTVATAPWPGTFSKPVAANGWTLSSSPRRTIALARGCSESRSTAEAKREHFFFRPAVQYDPGNFGFRVARHVHTPTSPIPRNCGSVTVRKSKVLGSRRLTRRRLQAQTCRAASNIKGTYRGRCGRGAPLLRHFAVKSAARISVIEGSRSIPCEIALNET
jgi:hypothetical protein